MLVLIIFIILLFGGGCVIHSQNYFKFTPTPKHQTTTNTHPQTNNHHLQHVPTQHYSTTYQQSLITPHSTTVSATRPKGGWLRLLTSGRYPINATVIARSSDSEAELRFYLLDGTAFCISVFATRPTTAGRRERSSDYCC